MGAENINADSYAPTNDGNEEEKEEEEEEEAAASQ